MSASNDALDLIARAKDGDSEAAAEIISAHQTYWLSAARQIIAADSRSQTASGPLEEPAELVQEAVLKLLELWSEGQGPDSNPRSYVTAIMRNTYANKLRSPRVLDQPFELTDHERSLIVRDDVRKAELHRELKLVRRAFLDLSPDHQLVLLKVTVQGHKVGDLTEELGRPAPAVSNLLARAKRSLFRLVLIEHLNEGGPQCRENAQQLPPQVKADPDEHSETERGLKHVRECPQCQRNWRRFATATSALGLLPILVVAQLGQATPAAATTVGAAPAPAGDEPPTLEGTGGDQAAEQDGPTPGVAGAIASVGSTPIGASSRIIAALSSRAVLGTGVAFLLVAGLGFAGHFAFGVGGDERTVYPGTAADQNPYGAGLEVELDTDAQGSLLAIRAGFSVKDSLDWSLRDVTLQLSAGTQLRSASKGLSCSQEGTTVVCQPSADTEPDGDLLFLVDNPEPGGRFSLQLTADVDGDSCEGRASGQW